MRLPCVRYTVRRLMVAAGVTLLALGAGIVWLRNPHRVRLAKLRSEYSSKAEFHGALERDFARLTEVQAFSKAHGTSIREGRTVHFLVAQRPELVPRYLKLSRYHGSLKQKYWRAASYPWLPVSPDPPAPLEPK